MENISNCLFCVANEVDVCRFDLRPCTPGEEREIFLGRKNKNLTTRPHIFHSPAVVPTPTTLRGFRRSRGFNANTLPAHLLIGLITCLLFRRVFCLDSRKMSCARTQSCRNPFSFLFFCAPVRERLLFPGFLVQYQAQINNKN